MFGDTNYSSSKRIAITIWRHNIEQNAEQSISLTFELIFFQELVVKQNIEQASKTCDDNRRIKTVVSDVWTGVGREQ